MFTNWILTLVKSLQFGGEAVDAFKDAVSPGSPGGEKITAEEVVDVAAHVVGAVARASGADFVVDITLLPSRERLAELLRNAGATVIDKGRRHEPTGRALETSLVDVKGQAMKTAEASGEQTSQDAPAETEEQAGEDNAEPESTDTENAGRRRGRKG